MIQKMLTVEAADLWVAEQRDHGLRIGFTCGAFDILHAGHVELLERARELCDRLLVAVNSDDSIRRYKSLLRPVNPEMQRMRVVSGLGCVDAVVLLEEQRPLHLIERWRPDLYIKGGDYSEAGLRSAPTVESYGGKVVVLPSTTDASTTAILNRVAFLERHGDVSGGFRKPKSNRIVFLDRDGTLIKNVPYLHNPAKVQLLPGVAESLLRLQTDGFRLVIVTNQQGIGLGFFGVEDFFEVNYALFQALSGYGVKIDKIYFCPHSLADECGCRKPETALLKRALTYYEAAPRDCWMIGDRDIDVAAGEAAGCRSLLVGPDQTFSEAVDVILGRAE